MGLLPCPLPGDSHATNSSEDQSTLSIHLHSKSSSSLSSQSSLPTVPSLTPQQSQPLDQSPTPAHRCCVATLSGHSSYVSSLALAGEFLYSGSSDGEVRAWNRSPPGSDAGHAVAAAAISTSAVKSVVASGDKLFTAHQDHKIRVWRIDADGRYRLATSLPTLADRLARLFLAKNYVEVRRHKKCTWVHHVDAVSSLALTHDGSALYSASWDRSFKVWRVSDFRCVESVERAHDDAINAVVVSRDGLVYTCSADRKIKVWRKESHQRKHALVATLERHRSAVNALALSEDCCILYSGACDRSILVWERVQDEGRRGKGTDGGVEGEHYMAVVGALRGHTKAVLCLAVAGDVVCSGSADHTVRVWRREGEDRSYSCLAVCEGHAKPVKCLAASVDVDGDGEGSGSPSGSGTRYMVYSGGLDCKIKVWRIWVPPSLTLLTTSICYA
ncbi:protein JINGUBANG-like isoform X2 [Rhodamnia argentea]|uniref:Protein JINGUBANG-like isoform X2 n=1 Tax=Rhodamnia argentea TaxID=178133 RepID=A0ABM3HJL0_9MYRT|nr:protein JINGUBANG-like isoform X2 [Rhodamnia argentea]